MTLTTRIIHTHDVQANWDQCADFVPCAGEAIVYDIDEQHTYERVKIGDGVHSVTELPFIIENPIEDIFQFIDGTVYADAGRITEIENDTETPEEE